MNLKKLFDLAHEKLVNILKYGSEEKGSSLCRYSILLGFIMSKKQERLRSELLSEDKITNLNLGATFLFLSILCSLKIERLLFLKFLKKIWLFLTAIFGHLTRLMKKSLPFL